MAHHKLASALKLLAIIDVHPCSHHVTCALRYILQVCLVSASSISRNLNVRIYS